MCVALAGIAVLLLFIVCICCDIHQSVRPSMLSVCLHSVLGLTRLCLMIISNHCTMYHVSFIERKHSWYLSGMRNLTFVTRFISYITPSFILIFSF